MPRESRARAVEEPSAWSDANDSGGDSDGGSCGDGDGDGNDNDNGNGNGERENDTRDGTRESPRDETKQTERTINACESHTESRKMDTNVRSQPRCRYN